MTDDDRLTDLLLQWEELSEQGREVSAEELCKDCPHLIDELARRIEAMRATAWMNQPVDDSGDAGGDPPSPALLPLAGRYRLVRFIAEGGFGQVWQGFDLELERTVAVKLSKPGRWGAVEQFVSEARRVARLRHPGIVSVHDVVRQDEVCFIVSDFVEGGSLREKTARGTTPGQSARWIADVAEALAYAAQQGFVHCDIKPENILIDHHGRALLGDFGIATTVEELSGQSTIPLGTLAYMSPEQVEGKPVDGRSDIYSLGVVLFELLTGRLPYQATDPIKLRREVAVGPSALFTKDDRVASDLRRICEKCLSREPAERYIAAELAGELRKFLTSPATMSKPWKRIAAATVLSITVVAAAAMFQLRKTPAEHVPDHTANRKPSVVRQEEPAAPPITADAAIALGKLQFDKGDYKAAAETFSEAVQLDPNSAEAFHRLGGSRFNLGQVEQALAAFNRAVELAPKNAEIRKHRATALLALKRWDDGFADLRLALELNPTDRRQYEELMALGFAHRASGHAEALRWADALADMDQVLRYVRTNADYFHKRAACYYNLMQFEKAVTDFTRAIELAPDNPTYYLNRGYAYQAIGELEKAEVDYEMAKTLMAKGQAKREMP